MISIQPAQGVVNATDPKYADAYYNRGVAFRERNLKPQAITDFEMYLQLSPQAADRVKVEQWLRELRGQ